MGQIDEVIDGLAAAERRSVCRFLLSRDDGTATVEELVVHVATETRAEGDPSIGDQSYRRAVAIALRHRHLPTLSEADLVEYDPDHPVVEAGPSLPDAEPILRVAEKRDTVVPA
jgi:hypothetical protein